MRNFGPPGGRMAFGGMGLTPGVKLLLIANGVMFVLQSILRSIQPDLLESLLTFIPQKAINSLQIWRFFTYMFLHGSFIHILFNMLGVWMFGTQIERRWGMRTFLIYYIVCGLGGAVTYGLFNLAGASAGTQMLGASGALYGILLAYGMTFPNSVILVMMIFPMKAKYAVIAFGVMALMNSTGGGNGGNIAHLAHLGGMIAGFIFLKVTIPSLSAGMGSSLGGDISGAWRRWQTKRKMKIVRPSAKTDSGQAKPGNGSAGTAKGRGKRSEIDTILDKISREGLQSLSDEEQEILRRAGRK